MPEQEPDPNRYDNVAPDVCPQTHDENIPDEFDLTIARLVGLVHLRDKFLELLAFLYHVKDRIVTRLFLKQFIDDPLLLGAFSLASLMTRTGHDVEVATVSHQLSRYLIVILHLGVNFMRRASKYRCLHRSQIVAEVRALVMPERSCLGYQ